MGRLDNETVMTYVAATLGIISCLATIYGALVIGNNDYSVALVSMNGATTAFFLTLHAKKTLGGPPDGPGVA